ncbi:hypothetical protein PVAP13_1NG048200 [Panicum virgatum]|uniref:Uncharacterized protein n=1 Tax=Panicum virgatum TaxID=38727 RepID=A0A8T0WH60_PANVG|nr:hypothetical protein PVAP13_1NG048200 [Panicum virgatum]
MLLCSQDCSAAFLRARTAAWPADLQPRPRWPAEVPIVGCGGACPVGRRSHAAEHGSTASELRECDGASLAQLLLARGSAASGAAARPLWRGSPGTAPTRTRWRSSSVQAPAAPQLVHATRGGQIEVTAADRDQVEVVAASPSR